VSSSLIRRDVDAFQLEKRGGEGLGGIFPQRAESNSSLLEAGRGRKKRNGWKKKVLSFSSKISAWEGGGGVE